ncbi:hypothetical protein Hdeb2414_s0001g00023831 [Helianthus debilis subsp. tardiflorus]
MTSSSQTHSNGGSSSEVRDVERTCLRCSSQWSRIRPEDSVRHRICIFRVHTFAFRDIHLNYNINRQMCLGPKFASWVQSSMMLTLIPGIVLLRLMFH